MRKSRFTEAQIIGMIKEQGSSVKQSIQWIDCSAERNAYGGGLPQAWPKGGVVLQVQIEIWWNEYFRHPSP